MSTRTLRAWYAVHKWTSLVCTAFLLLLCLTGLPLIFHHEIDHALGDSIEPPPGPADGRRASLAGVVDGALAAHPGQVVQFVWWEEDEPSTVFASVAETPTSLEATAFLTFDARSGEMLHRRPANEGFRYWMFKLHVDLFAGPNGTLFLGFMGLLFVASLVSGAVVYGPFMRKLPFGAVRSELSPRTRWLDLHNLLGIVTLAWALVVGVTGVINTLALPILRQWQATELAAMTAARRGHPPLEELGSIDRVLETARAAEPDMEPSFLAFPGTAFAGEHHYAAFMRGTTPLTSRLLKPVVVDARTSELTASRELPWYVKALLVSQPLHFGDYGGMPLKIVWALLDLVTIVVLGSGLYLWLARGSAPIERRIAELEQAALEGSR